MLKIFVSYARQNKDLVKSLVDDIESLGHTVWFDQELSGGQAWWDQILNQIRGCDVFVFVLAPTAVDSTACQREYEYAANVGRPVLPILVADGVSMNLLPSVLSEIQYVDYRKLDDRSGALHLARALSSMPAPQPIPNPLPAAPKVPLSYLGNLAEQVATQSSLSQQQQSALVLDLKRSLRNPETAKDGRILLEKLRDREDLFATTAEEIDELLRSTPASVPPVVVHGQHELPGPTTEVARLAWVRRSFLLFGPSTKSGWLIHAIFYALVIVALLGLLGLAVEPTDAKTGESTWAYGLVGLVLILGIPLFVLQRLAIRRRGREVH